VSDAGRRLGKPDADLARHKPLIHVVNAGQSLVRIHNGTLDPVYYGKKKRNRFDAPLGEFGVLYAAADLYGAFIETLPRPAGGIVSQLWLEQTHDTVLQPLHDLRLIDLCSPGAGADQGRCTIIQWRPLFLAALVQGFAESPGAGRRDYVPFAS
jgi:hypothetical protein